MENDVPRVNQIIYMHEGAPRAVSLTSKWEGGGDFGPSFSKSRENKL